MLLLTIYYCCWDTEYTAPTTMMTPAMNTMLSAYMSTAVIHCSDTDTELMDTSAQP